MRDLNIVTHRNPRYMKRLAFIFGRHNPHFHQAMFRLRYTSILALLFTGCAPQNTEFRRTSEASLPKFTFEQHIPTNQKGEFLYNKKGDRIEAPAKSDVPSGYKLGTAESYRRMKERLKKRDPVALAIAAPPSKKSTDAMTRYQQNFKQLGLDLSDPNDRLLGMYTLIYELGVRESDGRYYLGADSGKYKPEEEAKLGNKNEADLSEQDKQRLAETTEAGLYQTSWNTVRENPMAVQVVKDFATGTRTDGLKEVFSIGYGDFTSKNHGSGAGRDFQRIVKENPNLALEIKALTLRHPGTRWYFFTLFDTIDFSPEVKNWLSSQ